MDRCADRAIAGQMVVRPTYRRPYRRHARLTGAVGTAALALLAACSSNNSSSTPSTTAPMTTTSNASTTTAPIGAVVASSSVATLGVILVSKSGATLYRYAPDSTGHPTCVGACASAWPPLIVPAGSATPTAGSGVAPSDLGTVTRSGGALQVTYKKMPLYTYTGDSMSGQSSGQGVGGVWFVIPVSGGTSTAVTGTIATSTPTKPTSGY